MILEFICPSLLRHVELLVFLCMLIHRHCVVAREITKIHEEVVSKFFLFCNCSSLFHDSITILTVDYTIFKKVLQLVVKTDAISQSTVQRYDHLQCCGIMRYFEPTANWSDVLRLLRTVIENENKTMSIRIFLAVGLNYLYFIWSSERWAVRSLHLHPYCKHRSHSSHSL